MAEFVEDSSNLKGPAGEEAVAPADSLINYERTVDVTYCPTCTMPPEFCEYGASFEKCLPWILNNCPEVLDDKIIAEMVGKLSVDGEDAKEAEGVEEGKKKKKKGGGAAPLKKASAGSVEDARVVVTRVQRQKRKFVTVVAGLESVPDLKIKDASRAFGKKFSSGSSVNDAQSGGKEVVIQGDVCYDIPSILISDFKVPPTAIFFLEDGELRPYA